MIGLFLVAVFVSAAHTQYLASCPPEDIEVAGFRYMTRDLPPLAVPNEHRMEKDRTYAVPELQAALADIPSFSDKLRLPDDYLTDPFVERCCSSKSIYNCTRKDIELRYIKYQAGICWVVWPANFFQYTQCTCCTCLLNDKCPVVGRCVETDYVTIKIIGYCPHILYSDRYQKLAIRIPRSCECAASCPVPQNYFYKKIKSVW